MPINFPSSPSNNQLFVTEGKAMRYNATKNRWKAVSTLSSSQITDLENRTVGVSSMSISGNTLVIQKDDSSYANVSLASFAGNKLTTYANASILPLSDLVSGTQVYVEDTDSLYITDGSGWYKIATVNLSPSLTLGVESISLGSGDSVDVNYTVNEPEDTPYTVTASSTSNATITVYQANNTITFSAPVQDSTETITITATDGVNTVGDTLTMTIAFTFDWSTATQQANIQTNVTSGAPMFGYSVDLDNNGDIMIAGAKSDTTQANDSAGNNKGTLSVYTRSGSTWSRQQKITNPYNSSGSDQFGYSSAISGDGNTIIVGTPFFYNSNTSSTTGIAYVYNKSGSTWSLSKSFTSGNSQNDQWYGTCVDIDNDGTRIVVGAPKFDVTEPVGGGKTDAGYAFVYKNNSANMVYYDISGDTSGVVATSNNNSLLVSSQETQPTAFDFSSDGTKLFVAGLTNGTIFQYTLSTAWDISTGSYDNISFSISSQIQYPRGMKLVSNGSKLLVVGRDASSTSIIAEYDLSTANDLSSASYNNVNFTVNSQDTLASEITFNSDGTKMIMLGYYNDDVYEYSLSTAYDISTASYNNVSFSVSSQDTSPFGLAFNSDGTKMFICGGLNDKVFQYSLSSAYDISTASYDNISFSTAAWQTQPHSIRFNNDGSELFVIGSASDRIYAYTTANEWVQEARIFAADYGSNVGNNPEIFHSIAINSTGDTIVAGGPAATAGGIDSMLGSGVAYIFTRSGTTWSQQARIMPASVGMAGDDYGNSVDISDDGNTVVVGAMYDDDKGGQAGAAYVWSRGGSSWSMRNKLTASDGEPNAQFGHGVAISGDGSIITVGANKHNGATGKAYVFNSNTVGYNLGGASFTQSSSAFTTVESGLTCSLFNADGTKLYILGTQNYVWKRYSLSTAYDITTASYDGSSFDRSNTAAMQHPSEVRWGNSGSSVYIMDKSDNRIYQSNLTTPYDMTTASHWTFLATPSPSEGFDISPDGTSLLTTTYLYIFHYTLSTPHLISSATASGSSYTTTGYNTSICWNGDGTKFFVAERTNDKIYQYSVSNAYQLTGVTKEPDELDISSISGNSSMISFENGGSDYAGGKLFVIDGTDHKIHEWATTGPNFFQQKILTASDAASSSEYGWRTAMNQNGSTCAVSAIETNNGSSTQAGSVYIYTAS